jgi:acyl-CoA dehydrogenase
MTDPSAPVDPLLLDTVEHLLTDVCAFEVVERAETEGWCAPVWDALAQAGFPWVSVPEDAGGSGGTLADAMAVLRAVGRHAAPVPVAETGVLAGWLAAGAGLPVGSGPATVVPDPGALRLAGGRVEGEAVVAWARRSARVLALVPEPSSGWLIVSATPDQLDITARSNLAGEPRDGVRFAVDLDELEHAPAPPGVDGSALQWRGALTRVALAAGALERLGELTVDYAHTRRQFGRPIAAFQAVQHHLVVVAQAAARVAMAADVAVREVARGPGDRADFADLAVAAARVIADEASVEATRAAHQVHGAMGVTREYPLHHLSRRLWAWRHEYGDSRSWRRALGARLVAGGADELFPTITG